MYFYTSLVIALNKRPFAYAPCQYNTDTNTSGKTQFGNYLELGHITRNSGKSGINQG